MSDSARVVINVEAKISAPLDNIWKAFTEPAHVMRWNFATTDWCCPSAQNDLRSGGTFTYTMKAKDGSMEFDFEGTYSEVALNKRILYTMSDGRKVDVRFIPDGKDVTVIESFETEGSSSIDMHRNGWQAILDNFKKYIESLN